MGPSSGPSFQSSSSSSATGGNSLSPWYQGDITVAGGDAAGPNRSTASALSQWTPLIIVGGLLVGVVLWRRLSK